MKSFFEMNEIYSKEKKRTFHSIVSSKQTLSSIAFKLCLYFSCTQSFERRSLLSLLARGNNCCDLSPCSFSFSLLQKFTQSCLSLLWNNGTPFLAVTDIFSLL